MASVAARTVGKSNRLAAAWLFNEWEGDGNNSHLVVSQGAKGMTKFVTIVMAVAFTVVFSTAALADGWKIGNWEPPTKAPIVKAVSFNADWGTAVPVAPAASVAPAGCRGMVQHSHAEPAQRAGYNGGGWFLGWRIAANREARARAREARARAARAQYGMATGHS